MKNDEKGFSLIELLAIIVITSVIIVPLMTTFVNFFEINNRMHDRRNAVGIADVATNSIARLDYTDIYTQMHAERTVDHLYMMLTMDDAGTEDPSDDHCTLSFTNPTVSGVCALMFTMEYNNMTIPVGDMQIYFIDYNISTPEHQTLIADASLPQEVIDAIHGIVPNDSGGDVSSIMRYIVFLQYSDDPRGVVVLDGVFIDD